MSLFNVLNKRGAAAEMLTSAVCNMKCEYCYIPKTNEMSIMHSEIIEKIKSGEYINTLKNIYGEDLEHLSFWGTEPTLILQYITPNIDEYINEFNNLQSFSFSTNFLSNTNTIIDFIIKLNKLSRKYNKRFKIDIQISLDGPEFITDKNRHKGATSKIIENFFHLVDTIEEIRNSDITVSCHFKPTLSIDNIKEFNSDFNKLLEYYKFFDSIYERYMEYDIAKQEGFFDFTPPSSGTLMVPGKYTVEDGKIFAEYQKNLMKLDKYISENNPFKYYKNSQNEYIYRLIRIIDLMEQTNSKSEMFSCSGGDSNYAIDNKDNIHICHRSFYLNDDRYINSVLSNDVSNWDVSIFENSKINNVVKNFIVNVNNKKDVARFLYTMRGFHEFSEFRENMIYLYIQTLSKFGQVSEVYKENDVLSMLLSVFLVHAFGCSIENLLNTTSINLFPISLVRLWGNGAFELLVEQTLKYVK